MDERPTKRQGPIAFLLALLPAGIAIVGAGLIASPRLLFYVLVRHIESTGGRAPETPNDIVLAVPGAATLGTIMSICTAVGTALLLTAACLVIWKRRSRD